MVKIGTMTAEQAYKEKVNVFNRTEAFKNNWQCEHPTRRGARCSRAKWGKDQEFCWVHYNYEYGVWPMDLSED
jgi:hypothetical protein